MKQLFFIAIAFTFSYLQARAAPASGPAAVPSYVGKPVSDEANFQKFIISHINQRVYLKLDLENEQMYGYKSGDADPFLGLKYSYFFDCLEQQQGVWTARCAALRYNQATNSLSGYFYITEPSPKRLRTNRMFDLKPMK